MTDTLTRWNRRVYEVHRVRSIGTRNLIKLHGVERPPNQGRTLRFITRPAERRREGGQDA